MFLFKKKISPDSSSKKERLFFHDLINHTHGLLLFLAQKEQAKAGMDAGEVEMIRKEIKTLQSLIRDQYSFKHKNLIHSYDWVNFDHAYKAFSHVAATYFTSPRVSLTVNLTGDIALENSDDLRERGLIYYPAFYRIINNLVKNISEAEAVLVSFSFNMTAEGLVIETINSMKECQKDLPEYLSRVILSEKSSSPEGLGLESIDHIASEAGGSFSFEIHDQLWVNRIFLPTQNSLKSTHSKKEAA